LPPPPPDCSWPHRRGSRANGATRSATSLIPTSVGCKLQSPASRSVLLTRSQPQLATCSRRLTDCGLARCEAHYGLGTTNACACAFGCSNADAGFQRCQRQCDYQVPTPARLRRDRCQLSAPPLQCDGTAECSCGCSSCNTCTALPGSDDPNSCADPCNAGCLMA
jgi:hypothetical protein